MLGRAVLPPAMREMMIGIGSFNGCARVQPLMNAHMPPCQPCEMASAPSAIVPHHWPHCHIATLPHCEWPHAYATTHFLPRCSATEYIRNHACRKRYHCYSTYIANHHTTLHHSNLQQAHGCRNRSNVEPTAPCSKRTPIHVSHVLASESSTLKARPILSQWSAPHPHLY